MCFFYTALKDKSLVLAVLILHKQFFSMLFRLTKTIRFSISKKLFKIHCFRMKSWKIDYIIKQNKNTILTICSVCLLYTSIVRNIFSLKIIVEIILINNVAIFWSIRIRGMFDQFSEILVKGSSEIVFLGILGIKTVNY